jgi:hypothetical protein
MTDSNKESHCVIAAEEESKEQRYERMGRLSSDVKEFLSMAR